MGICENRLSHHHRRSARAGPRLSLAFAAEGANVVVNDIGTSLGGEGRDNSAAEAVVAEIVAAGGKAIANCEDITDWDAAAPVVEAALAAFDDLHVVVNNAGIVRDRMFVSATPEEWDATMHVHLRGHFCLSRHAVDYWRAKQKRGKIRGADHQHVVGSGPARLGRAGDYATAKGGIASLPLVQAAELGRYGITANALAPSARTRMTEQAFAEKMATAEQAFDTMDPANIAPTVVWLGSAESADVCTAACSSWGRQIMLEQGWRRPRLDAGARWAPADARPSRGQIAGRAGAASRGLELSPRSPLPTSRR